jgi:hypothetical protein
MARRAVSHLQKTPQKGLFRLRQERHIDRALAAAQHRAQRSQQKLIEIVNHCIAAAWVIQPSQHSENCSKISPRDIQEASRKHPPQSPPTKVPRRVPPSPYAIALPQAQGQEDQEQDLIVAKWIS